MVSRRCAISTGLVRQRSIPASVASRCAAAVASAVKRDNRHPWLTQAGEAEELGRFDPAHDRHVHVHDDQVEVARGQGIERLLAVLDQHRTVTGALQDLGDDPAVDLVVVGDQEVQRLRATGTCSSSGTSTWLSIRAKRSA